MSATETIVQCRRLGPPVTGCPCSFCRTLRPAPTPTTPDKVVAAPTGDFEDMRR